jgi:hypothetical protein
MKRLLAGRRVAVAVTVAAVAGVAALALVAANMAFSDEGSGIVDHSKITPLPFVGYPTEVYDPPAFVEPTCQAPEGEREDPSLPPLSCRDSGSEPPPGAIKTASPEEIPDKTVVTSKVPEGWTVIDNRLFRYTLAVPPDWYSTMRPEGGEFRLLDAVLVAKGAAKGQSELRGGIGGYASAREEPTNTPPLLPGVEDPLATPNWMFGTVPGAVWEEEGGHGTAVTVRGAFANGGIIYEIYFDVVDDGRDPTEVEADIALIKRILATITPY